MEERSFFSNGEVSVTNARFVVRGQTYAMAGVTSVKSFRQDPSYKGPIILGALGVLMLAAGKSGMIIGAVLLLGAFAWWRSLKPEFSVLLSASSGEARALTSTDGDFIASVVNALNEAIIHRG